MTYYDAWITSPAAVPEFAAELGVPHDPHILPSAWLPAGDRAYYAVRRGIEAGTLPGVQVNPLVWAALLDREQLLAFVDALFGPPGKYEAENQPHLVDKLRGVRAAVAALQPGEFAALVADEF